MRRSSFEVWSAPSSSNSRCGCCASPPPLRRPDGRRSPRSERVPPKLSSARRIARPWRKQSAGHTPPATDGMNELAPIASSNAPALVATAGARASYRFLEFFTAQIRNPHTRRGGAARQAFAAHPRRRQRPVQRGPIGRGIARVCQGLRAGGLEGIVSKRAGSRYRSGTSRGWLKSKNPAFMRG